MVDNFIPLSVERRGRSMLPIYFHVDGKVRAVTRRRAVDLGPREQYWRKHELRRVAMWHRMGYRWIMPMAPYRIAR